MTKRILDILVASALGVVLSPIWVLTSLAVYCSLGWPVLFRQERSGLCGRPFTILKFRTMTDARTVDGELCSDAERLTPLGRHLRAWSLDELPELLNVLRGDMSMVGPRPLLTRYRERYTPEQARRLDVRPGITGWTQVSGRNALGWDQKFAFDLWYLDHQSLWLDLRILLRTVPAVIAPAQAERVRQATVQEFTGNGSA